MKYINFVFFALIIYLISCQSVEESSINPPNIIVILADDLGYADLGCYGSEIHTPNIDKLASQGTQFTQFYTTARCCPSRASLLTGLYPHQTGIGHLDLDLGHPSYQGNLNEKCLTMAEVLRPKGYTTLISGKWHVGMDTAVWPINRGFDKSFFTHSGGNYFNTENTKLFTDTTRYYSNDEDFYLTDAITNNAIEFISNDTKEASPFFLYLTYTAPHFPLHAKESDVEKYADTYKIGWDSLRINRFKKMRELKVIPSQAKLSKRDEIIPDWNSLTEEEKARETRKMAVYAAMVDCVDQNIGKLLSTLEKEGKLENTYIFFMSDNGACHEEIEKLPWAKPNSAMVGTEASNASVGYPWASVSNTPFRKFKHWTHEGGIISPFIVWNGKNKTHRLDTTNTLHLIDIAPTIYQLAGADYPSNKEILPMEGIDFSPALHSNGPVVRTSPLYWEHEGNEAIRDQNIKLVKDFLNTDWEMYDLKNDPTEINDLYYQQTEKANQLLTKHEKWKERTGVVPWDGPKQVLDSLFIGWFGAPLEIR